MRRTSEAKQAKLHPRRLQLERNATVLPTTHDRDDDTLEFGPRNLDIEQPGGADPDYELERGFLMTSEDLEISPDGARL